MEIRALQDGDRDAVTRFLARVPAADKTFLKEDLDDPGVAERFMQPGAARIVALDAGEVVGWLNVVQLHGWSDHVGELRLIVDPAQRGRGIGRTLAQRAVVEALDIGLTKVVVEVIAAQEETIGMFRSLGFDPEALLADHVRDRNGELRDLMVLSQLVNDQLVTMITAGVADEL